MTVHRSVLAALLAGGLSMTVATGCRSSASEPGATPAPAPTGVSASASGLLSKAQSAASSALSAISGGVTAGGDVAAGPVAVDADGHAVSQLTVKNPTDADHDYTVSVIFDDSGGGLRDVVVVNASKVPAHGESKVTARSNRKLSGPLTVQVSAAVRH